MHKQPDESRQLEVRAIDDTRSQLAVGGATAFRHRLLEDAVSAGSAASRKRSSNAVTLPWDAWPCPE